MTAPRNPSIDQVLQSAPWRSLEEHLDEIRERVDESLRNADQQRQEYRRELLERNPDLAGNILRPSAEKLAAAEGTLRSGTVAAADGTLSTVALLGGAKIQVGVAIVFNSGEVVDLVTRVFEAEITSPGESASEFFGNLRASRAVSNILARAIMLYGERKLLLEQEADWRIIHGELFPYELRTGAGRPNDNLGPAFDIINSYISTEQFIAVSEGPQDIDILNAGILLQPGEYVVIRSLSDSLTSFLEGDPEVGQQRANFAQREATSFRRFIEAAGPKVSVVLAKAGPKPFLLECHSDRIEEAVSLFLADSLWTRGLSSHGSSVAVRGFPFHIDLADQVARTLFKGSDFRNFVEARLYDLSVETGLLEIDPRRTRG